VSRWLPPEYRDMTSETSVGMAGDSSQVKITTIPPNDARERLPQQLLNAPRWMLYKLEYFARHPNEKPRKVPHYVNGFQRCGSLDSPEDMAKFGTFDEALDAFIASRDYEGIPYEGIAFALGPDGTGNYWQGIDLDNIPQNELSDLANSLPSYVEMSPSGKGAHAIGYGREFTSLGSNSTGIEAYAGKRFFTFTGNVIRNAPIACVADFVQQQLAPRRRRSSGEDSVVRTWVPQNVVRDLRYALAYMRADDRDLWVRMGHALHELGETGRALWIEWSQTSNKWKPTDAKQWDTFKHDNTGYQAVFAEAQRQGWVNPNSNSAQGIKKGNKTSAAVAVDDPEDGFALPTPELRPEALYGILGEIAAAGSAHTEAVPAALAINTLARFCAVIGRDPHIALGDDLRSLRPFVLIIGPTGFGRKGTSAQLPGRIFQAVEAYLASWNVPILPLRHETAVSSGEGLVWMTRDPIPGKDGEMLDEGVLDKRVLLEISEFSGTLAQAKRESSTLTAVLRDAFDGRRLATPNKNNPCWATGAHFVTIGHITREELTSLLTQTDVMNGFANRFMMVYSARIKRVHEPQPTSIDVVNAFAHRIATAVHYTVQRGLRPVQMSEAARQRWVAMSDELEERNRVTSVAKLMARDSVYIWMLSAALALLNCEQVVEVHHLEAALAWVEYWEDTANFCFTTAARYDEMLLAKAVADEVVEAVRALGGVNVQHSAMTDRVNKGGNRTDRKAAVIAKGVAYLQNEAPLRIQISKQTGRGRTAITYSLVGT
jgi:hypothetical protein